MSKKRVKFVVKLAVSLAFIFWIFFKVDWREVYLYVREIKIWQVVAYLIFYFAGVLVSAYKWQILAKGKRMIFPLRDFFKHYITGAFINNFLPSFLGGDAYRSYQLGKKNGRFVEAGSTVMMDRITGFVAATIMAIIFAALNWKIVLANNILKIAYCLVVLSFIFDIAIAELRKVEWLRNKIKNYLPENVIEFFREVWKYNSHSHIVMKSIFWGAVFNFIGVAAANYLLFYALSIKIQPLDYLTVIFLISIVSAIPVSLNNIGIKEWAYITFFGVFGLSSSAVISVAILGRFLQMIGSFIALPIYLKEKKEKNQPVIG